ncbi:hypothetical protein E2C01_092951 [Portunus trituberculatus]|uniref:Uncharacterized protein n=1 Tax=Portunus trituberculatus TaxID=210409 RepID=A0A5B7JXC4_PORTR|nr:hypothetical protein [Portunus trituberculatus]
MHIMCCNNFIIFNAFHFSFTHCFILIFFKYPLVLISSITSTRFSFSIFSVPLTILYIVIRSPHSLLSCK